MKILVAGEGGQGVQVVAEILAKAAFLEGISSLYIPNFGVEQRGGVSLGFVVIDKEEVTYPKFEKADILAIFCDRAIERVKNYIGPKTNVILSPAVTNQEIAGIRLKSNLEPKTWNIIILGKILSLGDLVSEEAVKKTMEERFARWFEKNPALRDLDFQALEEGLKQ
ncbi:MAG: 2-oxoacid:acceptor oxidoreductase family protein [bacterium]|nr:2-oxoacid:acceptor oxidoreductase family protein [bacterium]